MLQIIRQIQQDIQGVHRRERGRLLVLTGARQVGKSTLASMAFPDYPVINLDSPVERAAYEQLGPEEWVARYPCAIIDEAQKLPAVIETVKACYDRATGVRYVLLGSSQILLLEKVRESLAGRAALRALFPFTLPELLAATGASRLVEILSADDPVRALDQLCPATYRITAAYAQAKTRWEYFLHWGGMPRLREWDDEDRFAWLQDYQAMYLQRDLGDLAQLRRLEPFVRAQQAAALRSGQVINFSDLARLSDVSPATARQFTRYLELSYQIILLPAWYRNAEKRLSKQSKLHFVDPGIRRGILRKRGGIDGAELESAVVAEIYKQCRNAQLPVELYHLRTADRREVDLLIEREDGFIAVEVKQTARISTTDFRHLRGLEDLLDKPLLLGLVASNDASSIPSTDGRLRHVAIPHLLSGAG